MVNRSRAADDEMYMPSLGPLRIHLLVYATSLVAHCALTQRWCRRLALPRRIGLGLSTCYLLGMAVGARLLYDVVQHQFHPGNYLRPAYYFGDGLWGGPLAYLLLATGYVMARLLVQGREFRGSQEWKFAAHARAMLDIMVLSLPISLAIAKVACLLNGCCFGAPCDWPWGVVYPYHAAPPAGIARHPTQIYEIAALLFIYIVLVTLERRRWQAMLPLWFVFLYGIARPMTEFFRMPSERRPFIGVLTASQAICLAGATVAFLALWWLRPPRRTFEPPAIRPAFGNVVTC